jgi:hypothetical protein
MCVSLSLSACVSVCVCVCVCVYAHLLSAKLTRRIHPLPVFPFARSLTYSDSPPPPPPLPPRFITHRQGGGGGGEEREWGFNDDANLIVSESSSSDAEPELSFLLCRNHLKVESATYLSPSLTRCRGWGAFAPKTKSRGSKVTNKPLPSDGARAQAGGRATKGRRGCALCLSGAAVWFNSTNRTVDKVD